MPYAPGITYDASPLGRGLESLGESIGQIVQEKKRKRKEYDALLKYGEATGLVDPDVGKTMSLEQLNGVIKAGVYKQEQARQAKTQALQDEQIERLRRVGEQEEAMAGVGRLIGERMRARQEVSSIPGMPNYGGEGETPLSQELLAAVGQNPKAMGPHILEALARLRAEEGRPQPVPPAFGPSLIGRPVPGFNAADAPGVVPLVAGPNSVDFVRQPASGPDRSAGVPAKLPDGTVAGHWFGEQWVPLKDQDEMPPEATVHPLKDAETGKPIPGMYQWRAGKRTGILKPPSMNPMDLFLARALGVQLPGVNADGVAGAVGGGAGGNPVKTAVDAAVGSSAGGGGSPRRVYNPKTKKFETIQ